MPDLTSLEIIRNAMGGDPVAFKIIVEKHQAFAYALAFRFVGNEEEAEDIVQESFVKLWKNFHTYRQEVKLTTWLYKIIANMCLDFLKSRRGKEKSKMVDVSKRELKAEETPETILHHQEIVRVMQQAAEELTPKQKAVFIMRDLEGLSTGEVKEILNMSEGNIKGNLFHARQKIAEKLKEIYQTTDKPYLS